MSQELFNQLVVIFLLAGIGFAARKGGIISAELQKGLSGVVINISVPCTILASASNPMAEGSAAIMLWIVGFGLVYHIAALFAGMGLGRALRLGPERRPVFACLLAFPNAAFIGFPIISVFLPETGILYASLFNITYNLVFFSLGTLFMSGEKKVSVKNLLGSIPTIASLLMVVLYVAQLKFPAPLQNTLAMVGGTSTPFSMIVIGSMLASVKIRELLAAPVLYLLSFLRLLVIPTAVFGLLWLLPVPAAAALVLVLMCGLPSGALTAIAAENHGKEAAFASAGVVHTTLFFAATVAWVAFLIGFI